ncbi:hypothetical protein BKA69DRAFT_1124815 [Paraphysoderma sedebokerense]|nr:hypothetical protein BKA69DRAFT_1124815 [Paraphysoderma sedebokerense]
MSQSFTKSTIEPLFDVFLDLLNEEDGHGIANFFSLHAQLSLKLLSSSSWSTKQTDKLCRTRLEPPWQRVVSLHFRVIRSIQESDNIEAMNDQLQLTNAFNSDIFSSGTSWQLPILYTLLKDTWWLAEKADDELERRDEERTNLKIDFAQLLRTTFSSVLTDRSSPPEISRRRGAYRVANMQLRLYFKVNQPNLCINVFRAVAAQDLPPLDAYPAADRVTFRYFKALLAFLDEDFPTAEQHFLYAFEHCHKDAVKNKLLILQYLIPLRLLRGAVPSATLLTKYPTIGAVYRDIARAVKTGNIVLFEETFGKPEIEKVLMRNGTYLTVERVKEVVLRNLFQRVFKINNSASKFPYQILSDALEIVDYPLDPSELQCILANMIEKGYIKGHIAYSAKYLVLSNVEAFPRELEFPRTR